MGTQGLKPKKIRHSIRLPSLSFRGVDGKICTAMPSITVAHRTAVAVTLVLWEAQRETSMSQTFSAQTHFQYEDLQHEHLKIFFKCSC